MCSWRVFGELPAAELEGVLKEMPAPVRRRLYLSAYDEGIRLATGFGSGTSEVAAVVDGVRSSKGAGAQRMEAVVVADIERELLGDTSLSPDERASVLLRRAKRFAEDGELKRAYQDVVEAREQVHDEVLRQRAQASLRKTLLRLGDEALIDQHLLSVPLPEDAFAYCRRGADALLCRGRQAAAGWYSEAQRLARSRAAA